MTRRKDLKSVRDRNPVLRQTILCALRAGSHLTSYVFFERRLVLSRAGIAPAMVDKL